MKTYLAIYLGAGDSPRRAEWDSMDEGARQKAMSAGMQAWGDWMVRHADAIVVEGGPLGKTKQAASSGLSDTRNDMSGYIVVRAESHEAAARMFEDHPHFAIFPGLSVEIMECLPMPGAA